MLMSKLFAVFTVSALMAISPLFVRDATAQRIDRPSDARVSPLMKAGEGWTNSIGMTLLYCPPGRFTMGGPRDANHTRPNEHEVDVELTRGFLLGKYEVTQKEWKTVMGNEPWKGRIWIRESDKHPAIYVHWEEAVEFCEKLIAKENKKYRLPTEAEWEYACRAGSTGQYYFGDASKKAEHAWYAMNTSEVGKRHPHPVGLKKANPWGFHDMYGNVDEHCLDSYVERVRGGRDPLVRIKNPIDDNIRVGRGGSFLSIDGIRSPARSSHDLAFSGADLGFRVCLEITLKE